jgi:hypothetical protein
MSIGGKNMKQGKRNEVPVRGKEKRRKRQGKWKEKNKTNKTKLQKTGGGNWVVNVELGRKEYHFWRGQVGAAGPASDENTVENANVRTVLYIITKFITLLPE